MAIGEIFQIFEIKASALQTRMSNSNSFSADEDSKLWSILAFCFFRFVISWILPIENNIVPKIIYPLK